MDKPTKLETNPWLPPMSAFERWLDSHDHKRTADGSALEWIKTQDGYVCNHPSEPIAIKSHRVNTWHYFTATTDKDRVKAVDYLLDMDGVATIYLRDGQLVTIRRKGLRRGYD